jgi:CNT family concentrative nucleoside transporter
MNAKRIIRLIALLIMLSSCTRKQELPLSEKIIRKWQYEAVVDSLGKTFRKVGKEDTLIIERVNNTNRFTYNLWLEGIHASGNWELRDSVLEFIYDTEPFTAGVDSSFRKPETPETDSGDVKPEQPAAVTAASQSGAERKKRYFIISECTENRLVFSENGIVFKFKYVPAIIEGNISVHSVMRGMLGLASLILILWLMSEHRRKVNWKLVASGILMQIIFAFLILKVEAVKNVFEAMGNFFVLILDFTKAGSSFVFGNLVSNPQSLGFVFAFQILPTILFFSALTSLLFYLGVLQKVVYAFAWLMSKTMRMSGAESLSAAGNIFLGQTESPLLIRPYLEGMNRSEILCVMCGGMATIAGGVMAAYIGFLGGDDPVMRLFYAKHLLAASIMSAPAAIVSAKILLPQTEEINRSLHISKEKIGGNFLEAIANGTTDGLRLAVNVGAMLVVFIAMIAMVNYMLKEWIGSWSGINEAIASISKGRYEVLSLQFLLGYLGAPLAWLMGTCKEDMVLVGQLLGEKTILNEFVAYTTLGSLKTAGVFAEQKSIIIATYILCGFANFASIGIQIGGIGALAPGQKPVLARLGFKALIGGTAASLFTAVIVGAII